MFSSRVTQRDLANLSRRVAIGLESGIEIRKVWQREASGRSSASMRRVLDQICNETNRGSTVSDAVAATGDFFPPLFREMVGVGEETGKLPDVFRNLAEHYEHQLRLKRIFMSAIAWPMIQLVAALVVVGFLIWIMGMLGKLSGATPDANQKPIDILGLGLVGNRGLAIYCSILAVMATAAFVVFQAVKRGLAWTRPLQRLVIRVPGLGPPLQTLALSRLAWSLHLTSETEMDLMRALPLCLRSTQNAYYSDHAESVVQAIRGGREISEAFAATGAFPREFLDTLEVGERSGRLPETMRLLSTQYQEQAQRALNTLTVLAGFAVWGIVAMIIITFIFRIAMFYVNTISDAASGKF